MVPEQSDLVRSWKVVWLHSWRPGPTPTGNLWENDHCYGLRKHATRGGGHDHMYLRPALESSFLGAPRPSCCEPGVSARTSSPSVRVDHCAAYRGPGAVSHRSLRRVLSSLLRQELRNTSSRLWRTKLSCEMARGLSGSGGRSCPVRWRGASRLWRTKLSCEMARGLAGCCGGRRRGRGAPSGAGGSVTPIIPFLTGKITRAELGVGSL
jgi:hypothetical protein